MYKPNFDEYDRQKLLKAKKLLIEVYEYNYKAIGMSRTEDKLLTVISKLEKLIEKEK